MPFLPLLSYVVHVLFQEKRVDQHHKWHSPDCPTCAAASTASCMFTLSVATGSAVDTPPDASSDAEATTATGATTPVPPGSATVSAPSTCVPGSAPVDIASCATTKALPPPRLCAVPVVENSLVGRGGDVFLLGDAEDLWFVCCIFFPYCNKVSLFELRLFSLVWPLSLVVSGSL